MHTCTRSSRTESPGRPHADSRRWGSLSRCCSGPPSRSSEASEPPPVVPVCRCKLDWFSDQFSSQFLNQFSDQLLDQFFYHSLANLWYKKWILTFAWSRSVACRVRSQMRRPLAADHRSTDEWNHTSWWSFHIGYLLDMKFWIIKFNGSFRSSSFRRHGHLNGNSLINFYESHFCPAPDSEVLNQNFKSLPFPDPGPPITKMTGLSIVILVDDWFDQKIEKVELHTLRRSKMRSERWIEKWTEKRIKKVIRKTNQKRTFPGDCLCRLFFAQNFTKVSRILRASSWA